MNGSVKFRLLETGRMSGAMNMAVDEAVLMHTANKLSLPTVRFYVWARPTLTLGYFQRFERDVDAKNLQAQGFDVVRRMTGGRAVLHDRELTYSVIVPGDHEWALASVTESYRRMSYGLRDGFRNLGVEAEIVSLADGQEREKYATAGSAACFDSPSWYELVVGGKKIAGSAQVRAHGGLLQHGSLLLDLDVDDLFSVLKFGNDQLKQQARQEFEERAISVKQLTMREVTLEEAVIAFAKGFQSGLGLELVPGALSAGELQAAKELVAEKYCTETWTKRR